MTPLRFIHIGDIHLAPGERNEDRRQALTQIVWDATADTTPVSAWFIPGDLNHGAMSVEDRNYLAALLIEMANVAPVVILYGNHDRAGELDVFGKLRAKWSIHVVAEAGIIAVQTPSGLVVKIACLPYPHRHQIVAAGVPPADIPAAAEAALDSIFLHFASELQRLREPGFPTLFLGHVNVAGARLSNGQPNIGHEIELRPRLLDSLGGIYKGLNHIHKRQDTEGGGHYAGSICRLDWGETDEKSYTEIAYWRRPDHDDWLFMHRQIPVGVPPMYHVEGQLTADEFAWAVCGGDHEAAAAAEQGGPGFFAGADVRVRYTFNAGDKLALDFERVKAPFVGARRLVLEPIPDNTRVVRAPEVAAAVTLRDKAAAFVTQAGTEWTPEMDSMLSILQTQDDADVTQHIAARIDAAGAEVVS